MPTLYCHSNCAHRGYEDRCENPNLDVGVHMNLSGRERSVCDGYEPRTEDGIELSDEEEEVLWQKNKICPKCGGPKGYESMMCIRCWRAYNANMKARTLTCPKCHGPKDKQASICNTCRNEEYRRKRLATEKEKLNAMERLGAVSPPPPPPQKMGICPLCTTEFVMKRKDHKYCSEKCLIEATNYNKCPRCGRRKAKKSPNCRKCRKELRKVAAPPEQAQAAPEPAPKELESAIGDIPWWLRQEADGHKLQYRCERCSALITEPQPEPYLREPLECYKGQGGCGKRAGKHEGGTRFTLVFNGDPPYRCSFPGCKFESKNQNALRGHMQFGHNLKYHLPLKSNIYYKKLRELSDEDLRGHIENCPCNHQPPCIPCRVAYYILHEREHDEGKQHWDTVMAGKAKACR